MQRVLPLRAAITFDGLRPPSACLFDTDTRAEAVHFVAHCDGRDVAAASLSVEHAVVLGREVDWKLQFLVVEPQWRGRGIASALIHRRLAVVSEHGAQWAWCQARTYATPLYEHLGARREARVYDLDPIGPHVNMLYGPLG